MTDVNKSCMNHPELKAVSEVMFEGGAVGAVCQTCRDKLNPKVTCRHCHVEMVSRTNFYPILGRSHKKGCPRHKMYG